MVDHWDITEGSLGDHWENTGRSLRDHWLEAAGDVGTNNNLTKVKTG